MLNKKALLVAVATVIVACCALFFMKAGSKQDVLLAENVEVLADGESSGKYVICYSESKVRKGYTYYDCGTCQKVYDEQGKGPYSKCFL